MFADIDQDEEVRQHLRDDAVKKLRSAAVSAAQEKEDEMTDSLEQVSRLPANMIGDSFGKTTQLLEQIQKPNFDRIKLTKQVTKWLSGGGRGNDAKLRDIFLQRIKQLAAGDRSRILRKRLAGARNMIIYETYMDGNFRILWTEDSSSEGVKLGLVVWCVEATVAVMGVWPICFLNLLLLKLEGLCRPMTASHAAWRK